MSLYTLIIVNWNSWDLLYQCLEKLEAQTFQEFAIVAIDNASDQPVPPELLARFPDIMLIENQTNDGFAKANNQAFKMLMDTEWVILLNPDAFPEPDWLEQLNKAKNDFPEYSMYASRLIMVSDPDKLDGDGDNYHFSGLAWRTGHGKSVNHDVTPKEIFSPCAAAAMYRTNDLLEVGGFDEDFFCYFEDVDLGFRMRLQGHKCLLVTSAIVHHVGSATTGGQRSDFSVYHGHRNLVWAYIKNMPGLLFWVFLPYHILLNIISIVVFVWRGQGTVILRAKWDALKGVSAMWHKRKVIQSNRVATIKDIWRVMDKSLIPWNRRY